MSLNGLTEVLWTQPLLLKANLFLAHSACHEEEMSTGPGDPKECQVKGCYLVLPLLLRLGCHIINVWNGSSDTTFRFAQPTLSEITWEPSGNTQMAGIASNEKRKVLVVKFISLIGHRISIRLQALSVSPLASTKVAIGNQTCIWRSCPPRYACSPSGWSSKCHPKMQQLPEAPLAKWQMSHASHLRPNMFHWSAPKGDKSYLYSLKKCRMKLIDR